MNSSKSPRGSDFNLAIEYEASVYRQDLADLELVIDSEQSSAQKERNKNRDKRLIKEKIESQLEKIRERKEHNVLYDDWN
ncbi:hypothetical protein [Psychromonas antarctica]|jgi:hypothetical protein|uniref:hypothetical protein n=1 Tax=Psychromonas antarctica TaxID=67573 RepID=UPI001EE7DB3E|nr:hypothetical protein [Psychromonas antarctica]MCG6201270.1 hypothetical protein [Psychromonas antarctica]